MSIILNDISFNMLLWDTLVELFFARWYDDIVQQNTWFCWDTPPYFFRYNKRDDILILPRSLSINTKYKYTKKQAILLQDLLIKSTSLEVLRVEICKYIPDWSIFIGDIDSGGLMGVKSFEDVKISTHILSFFSRNQKNFYIQQGELLFYYQYEDYQKVTKLFTQILKQDPWNPFVLLRYARYLWSVLYKYDKKQAHIEIAIEYASLAIENLKGQDTIFSFCYSWLGQLYSAKMDYTASLTCYEKTISINASRRLHQDEPYIWKANALSNLKKYHESMAMYNFLLERWLSDKQSNDFRNFKIMAINYWNTQDIEKFQEMFIRSISLLMNSLEEREIFVTLDGYSIWVTDYIKLLEGFRKDEFNSFVEYYQKAIYGTPERIREIVVSLAFIFLGQATWKTQASFHTSRWLEQLSLWYITSSINV